MIMPWKTLGGIVAALLVALATTHGLRRHDAAYKTAFRDCTMEEIAKQGDTSILIVDPDQAKIDQCIDKELQGRWW